MTKMPSPSQAPSSVVNVPAAEPGESSSFVPSAAAEGNLAPNVQGPVRNNSAAPIAPAKPLRKFRFTNGEGNLLSSRLFDRALEKAMAGNSTQIAALSKGYESRRAGCVLIGRGTTRFDAWAFARADMMLLDPVFIKKMADLGLLRHARHPRNGHNLANEWVDWDSTQTRANWKILAEAGVDLNNRNSNGLTPLEQARENANARLVAHLLDLGADPSALGWPPEEVASFKQSLKEQSGWEDEDVE